MSTLKWFYFHLDGKGFVYQTTLEQHEVLSNTTLIRLGMQQFGLSSWPRFYFGRYASDSEVATCVRLSPLLADMVLR